MSAGALAAGCGREAPFHRRAMVVLPDHLHTIWTLPDGDSDYSMRWNQVKGLFSRNYTNPVSKSLPVSRMKRRERDVWQRRFWEHTLMDQEDFNRHCDYIHYNPVRHGLAKSPAEWEKSSFGKYVEKGLYKQDWGRHADKAIVEMDLE